MDMENARTIVGACVSLAGLLKKIVQVGFEKFFDSFVQLKPNNP